MYTSHRCESARPSNGVCSEPTTRLRGRPPEEIVHSAPPTASSDHGHGKSTVDDDDDAGWPLVVEVPSGVRKRAVSVRVVARSSSERAAPTPTCWLHTLVEDASRRSSWTRKRSAPARSCHARLGSV